MIRPRNLSIVLICSMAILLGLLINLYVNTADATQTDYAHTPDNKMSRNSNTPDGELYRAPNPVLTKATRQAVELARSQRPKDHQSLRAKLTDPVFLANLNTESEYMHLPPEGLQLYAILEALAKNTDPLAGATMNHIATDREYLATGILQETLVSASAAIASPPDGIRELWQQLFTPGSYLVNHVARALLANRSPVAIDLFCSGLLTNNFDTATLSVWFREYLIANRYDSVILDGCQRLLSAPDWPGDNKELLVEVLFDYDPEWYAYVAAPPQPPSFKDLTVPARKQLLDIARLAFENGLYMDQEKFAAIRARLSVPSKE